MIGRLLCRFGWHKWRYWTSVDFGVNVDTGVTMRQCQRRRCVMPIEVVDTVTVAK